MRFIARDAGVEENEEDDFLDVWMAEGGDPSGNGFSFQCALHEVDQDEVDMGLDSYCVATQNGATVYGPVRAAEFDENVLILTFAPDDADLLRTSERVEIVLAVGANQLAAIKHALRRVLSWGRSSSVPSFTGF
ncbi:Imm10 family immunity protein [Micromonospora gifhornensis]|uniref:Imm10 family immunity protein n=1 Tax=Micromonospora gifhornensis TaxID=84594 RepID=UPI00366712E5